MQSWGKLHAGRTVFSLQTRCKAATGALVCEWRLMAARGALCLFNESTVYKQTVPGTVEDNVLVLSHC